MSEGEFERLCEVSGSVSRETFLKLKAFEAFFLSWAQRINLVSSTTFPELWSRHILDSAQLAPLAPTASRWLDLGSGGGFPGLVIAILCEERMPAHVDLVESNAKKAGFLRAAVGNFDLPAAVHARRIEALHGELVQPHVVTARALAPLSLLLELTHPWLSRGATALLHKGRDYQRELTQTVNSWTFDLVEHQSRIDPASVILELRDVRRLE